jgi:hypothetical protein
MSYDPQIVNMSLIVPGGKPNATVTGLVIQEVDKDENVFFQWRSWDHFEITDATEDIDLTAWYIDYVHANAFDLANDGHILLSSRHLDEITKINFGTGDIIWRFGPNSENNQFTINNDPSGFTHQHDVRCLPNGNITLFDNGNLRLPNYSQALEYQLDEINKVATRVWHYQHSPSIFAPVTGSHRRSDDGRSLIGWGGSWPVAGTEVNLFGTVMMEIFLPDTVTSYRCLKYPWKTNKFTSLEHLHLGNVAGNGESGLSVLPVTNKSAQPIAITSFHTLSDTFNVETPLPVTIQPGATADLVVSFVPAGKGDFADVLTLNYDNYNLTVKERIAIQIKLYGVSDNTLPVVSFIPSFDSTNIDPDSDVIIMFSEPVRKKGGQEISDADLPGLFAFRYKDQLGDPVPFTGHITADKKTVTLTPDSPLLNFVQYYVEMQEDTLEDYQGQVLNYPEATMFTTGDYVTITDQDIQPEFKVFPSPILNLIYLQSCSVPFTRVRILDLTGRVMKDISCDDMMLAIPVEDLTTGIYLIEVRSTQSSVPKVFKAVKK